MAETFLSPVIERLVDLVGKEAKSLKAVRGEVKNLQAELELIELLLKDAEAKSEKEVESKVLKAWLKQLGEEASHIEDVVDHYRYLLEQRPSQRGFTGSLRKARYFIKALKPRHEIASEIQSIKRSLTEIKGRGQSYGLRPLEQRSSSGTSDVQVGFDPRLHSLFMEKDELVGIESASTDLIRKLVEGASTRLIISLEGQGGVGKTTLAKKVYDDVVVKKHFELASAWITVSQPYNPTKVLKDIKEEMCKSGDSIVGETDKIEKLIECLRTYLQTKRYVIFFDDVWEQNFWDDIKLALPNNIEGSRIVTTTRTSAIADCCKKDDHVEQINLEPWSLTLALELFCKKAFKHEFQGVCPSELGKLSMEIVRKCQGLPLVIATIASLLSTKDKVESEWRKILDDLNSKVELNLQMEKIRNILSLSYYDLPYSLRSCFLYFGVFHEDDAIYDERLFRLWSADGFLKTKGEKPLEEVAEEYLAELTKRNLVTVDRQLGEGNRFRVHDLMHDVLRSKGDDVCFCQTWDSKKSKSSGKGRRLMISGSTKDVLENVESFGVRSIFIFDIEEQLTKSFVANLFKKFKLMTVLDINNAPIGTLPKELGKLLLLKYLSLRNTQVKVLPKSIGKLRNLESLDIRDTFINRLPEEINKLTNLRHLLAYRCNFGDQNPFDCVLGVVMQEGFGQLEELQTLECLEADIGGINLIKELEKLRKLRWFGISKLNREIYCALCSSIEKMNYLKRLCLKSIDENEVLDLQYISSPPHFLQELVLDGRLEKMPEWILMLRNLQGLCLAFSRLIDDPAKCLQGLSNLEELALSRNAYDGERLHFEAGGFQKLKSLALVTLDRLKVVKIDGEALPLLERLQINGCPQLQEVPSIQHLRNIKYVVVNGKLVN